MSACVLRIWAILLLTTSTSTAICPSQCSCSTSTKTVNCQGGSLEHFPIQLNPRVKRINLDDNRIGDLQGSFDYYTHLVSLSLRRNLLKQLSARTFEHQLSLQQLDVAENWIAAIDVSAFSGLSNLRHLDLSRNRLSTVPAGAFGGLKSLSHLALANNRIQHLSSDVLADLAKLDALDLADNLFVTVPDLILLGDLKELMLQRNRLNTLSSFPSSLQRLDLSGNGMKNISIHEGPPSIQHLNISWNMLTSIPVWVSRLRQVLVLDISGNNIAELRGRDYGEMSLMREFHSCHQPHLTSVQPNIFTEQHNLSFLHLCNNTKLTFLNDKFLELASLQGVNFQNNSLAAIPKPSDTSSINLLDVRGNPIECNCSLQWLNQWILNGRSTDVECFKPDHLKGRFLSQLDSKYLSCRPQLLVLVIVVLVPLVFLTLATCSLCCFCRRNKTAASTTMDPLTDSIATNGYKEAFSSPPLYLVPPRSNYDFTRLTSLPRRPPLRRDEDRVVSLYAGPEQQSNSDLYSINHGSTLSTWDSVVDHTAAEEVSAPARSELMPRFSQETAQRSFTTHKHRSGYLEKRNRDRRRQRSQRSLSQMSFDGIYALPMTSGPSTASREEACTFSGSTRRPGRRQLPDVCRKRPFSDPSGPGSPADVWQRHQPVIQWHPLPE